MNKNKERSTVGSRIRPLLVGVGAGVGVGLLLMLATAAVMALVQVSAAVVTPMAMGVLAVAALVGGFVTARLSRERGLLYGAACGLLLFLVVAVIGLAVMREIRGTTLFLKLALTVGGGALGGILGVNVGRR